MDLEVRDLEKKHLADLGFTIHSTRTEVRRDLAGDDGRSRGRKRRGGAGGGRARGGGGGTAAGRRGDRARRRRLATATTVASVEGQLGGRSAGRRGPGRRDMGGGRRQARARGGPSWAGRAAAVEAVAAPCGATGVGGGDVRCGADNVRRAEAISRFSRRGIRDFSRGTYL